jgi:hypothetical protein
VTRPAGLYRRPSKFGRPAGGAERRPQKSTVDSGFNRVDAKLEIARLSQMNGSAESGALT